MNADERRFKKGMQASDVIGRRVFRVMRNEGTPLEGYPYDISSLADVYLVLDGDDQLNVSWHPMTLHSRTDLTDQLYEIEFGNQSIDAINGEIITGVFGTRFEPIYVQLSSNRWLYCDHGDPFGTRVILTKKNPEPLDEMVPYEFENV